MRFGNPSKKTKVIASLTGHAIEFPGRGTVDPKTLPAPHKDFPERATIIDELGTVYVYVPPKMEHEVAGKGMVPESEMEQKETPEGAVKPEDPAALQKDAFEAFDKMVAAGDRESFAGNGFPKAQAVEKALGYALTKNEIHDLWSKFQLERAGK